MKTLQRFARFFSHTVGSSSPPQEGDKDSCLSEALDLNASPELDVPYSSTGRDARRRCKRQIRRQRNQLALEDADPDPKPTVSDPLPPSKNSVGPSALDLDAAASPAGLDLHASAEVEVASSSTGRQARTRRNRRQRAPAAADLDPKNGALDLNATVSDPKNGNEERLDPNNVCGVNLRDAPPPTIPSGPTIFDNDAKTDGVDVDAAPSSTGIAARRRRQRKHAVQLSNATTSDPKPLLQTGIVLNDDGAALSVADSSSTEKKKPWLPAHPRPDLASALCCAAAAIKAANICPGTWCPCCRQPGTSVLACCVQ